jgi:hypothetical protein
MVPCKLSILIVTVQMLAVQRAVHPCHDLLDHAKSTGTGVAAEYPTPSVVWVVVGVKFNDKL